MIDRQVASSGEAQGPGWLARGISELEAHGCFTLAALLLGGGLTHAGPPDPVLEAEEQRFLPAAVSDAFIAGT